MSETPAMTGLVVRILAMAPEDRKTLVRQNHPDYETWKQTWEILLDAYDGSGGFLSGDYIWKFPRELPEKYRERCEQARYHNYTETLVDLYVRYAFGQPVVRTAEDEALTAWWADVDGEGMGIDAFLRLALAEALASGHVGILADRAPLAPIGPAKADERAPGPYLVRYAPLAIRQWALRRSTLTSVGIAEVEQDDIAPIVVWDEWAWVRLDAESGDVLDAGEHGLGRVPLTLLRPKASHRYRWIGKPLINANVVRALYNRASEEDEVLRASSFSMLTVSVPSTADQTAVEQVRAQIGDSVGTTTAMVVQGTVEYKTPDQAVAGTLAENQAMLVRELWRMAHLRFERDSLAQASAEAIRLQNAELNQMLNGLAAELTRVELDLTKLYFSWTTPTPEQAARAFEAAQVSVTYPREFFTRDLLIELQAWAEAIKFDLGATMAKRIKQRVVERIEPDMDQDTKDTIFAEIESAPEVAPSTAAAPGGSALTADALRASAAVRLKMFAAGGEGAPS